MTITRSTRVQMDTVDPTVDLSPLASAAPDLLAILAAHCKANRDVHPWCTTELGGATPIGDDEQR